MEDLRKQVQKEEQKFKDEILPSNISDVPEKDLNYCKLKQKTK